jgi:tetratricopeptide (TPR) repeat protein
MIGSRRTIRGPKMLAFPFALALAAAVPAQPASPAPTAAAAKSEVDRAAELIGAGKPAEAVALLDTIIADQERQRRGDTRQVYCARSPAETVLYSGQAAQAKKAAVVLAEDACYSVFLKGFALIDLNRGDEAKAWLERAVAMAPSNAHFLGELAEWYKIRRDWTTSRALFGRAVAASELSPDNRKVFDKTRGLRGLGYILIEEGKLDEAEALYRQCLALDPTDERSKKQLDYIAGQRGKKI